ncbi:MAG TPA: ATP-binding protein [Candidatus Acidoferrum sp.]|jgi:two-component system NarL family sensor kinase|nr:ATP-binding protein [Candidatus Acidoferrum sp.]
MKTARRQRSSRSAPSRKIAQLRARLADAEEILRAIRSGEVDAVVIAGKQGPQVFTLQGAEHPYRILMESMNEGALTLAADKTILYANQCFARLVKSPLERVIGKPLRRFLSAGDRLTLRSLLKRAGESGSKFQGLLTAGDASQVPVQFSIRKLAKDGSNRAACGIVVTDMTEARRNEEMLRALSHRLVQAQEAERGRVALELHDGITQLLCAVLVRSQALADKLPARDGPAKSEAIKLRQMLGQTANEVERISRNLRPSILDELGLPALLRGTTTEFANRTGLSVELACVQVTARLPADTELTLYRILQEGLKNIEKHASARHVTVRLRQQDGFVLLSIKDDGIGFDPDVHPARRKGKGGLDLFGMQERATYIGGALKVKSARGAGTEIEARIPLSPGAARAHGTDL